MLKRLKEKWSSLAAADSRQYLWPDYDYRWMYVGCTIWRIQEGAAEGEAYIDIDPGFSSILPQILIITAGL